MLFPDNFIHEHKACHRIYPFLPSPTPPASSFKNFAATELLRPFPSWQLAQHPYSSVYEHHSCPCFLHMVNRTSVNMSKQVSLQQIAESLGYMPRNDVNWVLWKGRSVFSFLKNVYADLHIRSTNLHPPQQRLSILLSLSLPQHLNSLMLFVFLISAIWMQARLNLNVVVICNSVTAKSMESFFRPLCFEIVIVCP